MQRVVGRDDEANSIDEELGGDVEEDEEEVGGGEAEHDVDLGHARLLLELVQVRVLAELGGVSLSETETERGDG